MLLNYFKKNIKPASDKLDAMMDADNASYKDVFGPEPEQVNDRRVVVKDDDKEYELKDDKLVEKSPF